MKILSQIILSSFLFFAISCTEPAEQTAMEPMASGEKTQEVLDHHLASVGENNLAEIMADYVEESVVMAPDTTYRGLEQIEGFFTGLLPAFPTEGTVFEVDKMTIENELAYIVWHASTPSVIVPFGTDTFIIEDGKIKLQTFAAVINPVE